jgi:hypothetical protein
MTIALATAFEAFIREHEYCGELDIGGSRTNRRCG